MYSMIPFIKNAIYYLIVIIPGLIIQIKLYKHIKDEEHGDKGKVIQRILKTYSIVQCVGWPMCFVLRGILFFENPIWDIVNISLMYYLLWFYACATSIVRHFAAFNSLIIAISRYAFLVFNTKAETFGIRKLRKFFITTSVAVPITLAVIGQCVASAHEWLVLMGLPDEIAQKFVNTSFNSNPGETFVMKDAVTYSTINQYFPSILLGSLNITFDVLVLIIYSNIAEAFIYVHIFIFILR